MVTVTVTEPIVSAQEWPTNAELIQTCADLGYLRPADYVLDPTFEKGIWWKRWRPARLEARIRAEDGFDFRDMDYPEDHFDAVAYDPPYVCPGGRATSTLPELHDRYGMDGEFKSPEELQRLINQGLSECYRVVKPAARRDLTEDRPNGIVLVKCQDYNWGGRLWEGATFTRNHAVNIGFVVEDRLEMIGSARAQPKTNPDGSPRRQVHSQRNLSTLFVLRKLRSARPTLF